VSFEVEPSLSQSTSRRSIVKTGAKLAYAAPLVAASMTLHTAGATPVSSGGGTCEGYVYKVTLMEGPVLCSNEVHEYFNCCQTNADCAFDPDLPMCFKTAIVVATGNTTRHSCPVDSSMGYCAAAL
jgi:hypothetical protein